MRIHVWTLNKAPWCTSSVKKVLYQCYKEFQSSPFLYECKSKVSLFMFGVGVDQDMLQQWFCTETPHFQSDIFTQKTSEVVWFVAAVDCIMEPTKREATTFPLLTHICWHYIPTVTLVMLHTLCSVWYFVII